MIGRGAVNQKGPESAFLAALHAIRGAGQKMPVNLVLIAEGEEEIGSPHIGQLVHRPEVEAALAKTIGVFMPSASQDLDGQVSVRSCERSEEHTSELQSLMRISYAVFCLKKKKTQHTNKHTHTTHITPTTNT